jgi:hypothetical protein
LLNNICSPLQVKNKPHDGDPEHVFILGSMDCMVANRYKEDHRKLYFFKNFISKTRLFQKNVVEQLQPQL